MRKEWGGWIKNRQWELFEKEAREEPSPILANTVGELLRGFPDKADKRALKRILYFLKQAGYEPEDIGEVESEPMPEGSPYEQAFMSTADAQGDSELIYGRQNGNRVRWLATRIHEVDGLVGAKEEETSMEERELRVRRYLNSDAYPMVVAEVPVSFALWRLKRALAKNRQGVPPTVAYWRSVFESAADMEHPALALPRQKAEKDEIRRVAFFVDAATLWRLELGTAAVLLRKLQESSAGLPDDVRRERTGQMIDETRREAFTESVLQDHATRLLDLAFLLDRSGQAGSGLVMAAYDDLLEKGAESDYARSTMDKTLVTYVETMKPKDPPQITRT